MKNVLRFIYHLSGIFIFVSKGEDKLDMLFILSHVVLSSTSNKAANTEL